jgi:hypothetical protein
MYTLTTKFFILVAFVVATCTATTTDTTIAEISVDMAPAKLTLSGTTSATNDNWVGGESSLNINTKVAVEAAKTSITIGTKIKATTKECNLTSTSPSASVTITLELPDAFITALSTLDGVIDGLPKAADLVKPFTFEYAGDADGVSVLVSDVAVGPLKQNLQMTGSDIKIEIKKADIGVKQAGLAVPMTATVTLMDPTKITIPISGACGDGQSTVCAAGITKKGPCSMGVCSTIPNPLGVGCKAFCTAIKAVAGDGPAFSMKVDIAAQLKTDAKLISVGDVSAVCAPPPSEDEKLSAGSTPTVSFGAVATVLMLLLSAFH